MYALIRKRRGGYYGSMVFGLYRGPKDQWGNRCIVLNEEKTALVKKSLFWSKPLSRRVIETDLDRTGWVELGGGVEAVGFLSGIDLVGCVEKGAVPEELTKRCVELDRAYRYEEVREVLTDDDARDFDWASGGLHDAYVVEVEELDDEVRVLLDTTWGCGIEAWFSGDPSYDVSFRDPEYDDVHWSDSSVTLHGGFVYLVDDEHWAFGESLGCRCWFKGRSMRYRVIPD